MSEIKKFFRDNPKELHSLIPVGEEEEFYNEIKIKAEENVKNGNDVTLTRSQMIEICVKVNRNFSSKKENKIFFKTEYGEICLN